jgi:uracil-DNA glycosylase family 4
LGITLIRSRAICLGWNFAFYCGTSNVRAPSLAAIHRQVVSCTRCPRLRGYCARIGQEKRAAYRDEDYWARPVPGFGDPRARLLVLGLAPGAHGANRTGRMFTGDSSGAFLMRAMHAAGFASVPWSRDRQDGLQVQDAYILAAVRCAPPDNKPTPTEIAACHAHLDAEWSALPRVSLVIALGRLAFDAYWRLMRSRGIAVSPRPTFGHGREYDTPGAPALIAAFHPSQQNTFTGRLTPDMLEAVFRRAAARLAATPEPEPAASPTSNRSTRSTRSTRAA